MGLETPGPHLKRQPPGYLAHGREQRQGAILQLNGFIAERGHLPVQQHSGELFCCGKMEVGKQDEAGSQQRILGSQGFFDLEDQGGLLPDLLGGALDMRPGRGILLVRNAAPGPGPGFNDNPVAVRHQSGDATGRDGHAGLLGFDFLGNTNHHTSAPFDRAPFAFGLLRSGQAYLCFTLEKSFAYLDERVNVPSNGIQKIWTRSLFVAWV